MVKFGNYSTMDSKRYVTLGDGAVYLISDDVAGELSTDRDEYLCADSVPTYDTITGITATGVQTVLPVILYIADLKPGVQRGKPLQKLLQLFLIHRERRVIALLPDVIGFFVGQRFSAGCPADFGHAVGVHIHNVFIDGRDFVDMLLHAGHQQNDRAKPSQHTQQDQEILLSFHTVFLLRRTSSTPSSRTPSGIIPIRQTFSQFAAPELMVR